MNNIVFIESRISKSWKHLKLNKFNINRQFERLICEAHAWWKAHTHAITVHLLEECFVQLLLGVKQGKVAVASLLTLDLQLKQVALSLQVVSLQEEILAFDLRICTLVDEQLSLKLQQLKNDC